MKRKSHGIFFTQLKTLSLHLKLNFTMDYLEDEYLTPPDHTHHFLNSKSARSKLMQALHDIA